jgi:metal-responsive CopG/Arc/MetJ family transcriptional regulator
MERVMFTLPGTLLEAVDRVADDLRENRSEFIRRALEDRLARVRREAFEALLAEGYRAMAGESETIAREAEEAQSGAVGAWQWD